MPNDQAVLVDIPQQPEVVSRAVTAEPRLRTINRDQTVLVQMWVDELIPADHKARGMLEASALLSLDRVMHDGTKIRAQAGTDTFRREKSLREHVERANKVVESMGDPRAEAPPSERHRAARERAARERRERLEEAL